MNSYLGKFYLSDDIIYTDPNPLFSYIQNRMMEDQPPEEGRVRYIARRTLQVASVAVATAGNYPFVAISLKLGGNNLAYAIALAYGNAASYEGLIVWSLFNMIEEYLGPREPEEQALLKGKMQWTRGAILVSSVAIGVISQTPLAYMGYAYNKSSIRLLMPIMTLASDSWFPIYSTNLGLRRLFELSRLSAFEKQLVRTREKIVRLISTNRELLTTTDLPKKMEYVKALGDARASDAYVKLLAQSRDDLPLSPSRALTVAQYAIKGIGLTLIATHMFFLGFMGYKGAELLWDNEVFDISAAGLIVTANVYLEGLAIPQTAVRIFNTIKDALFCRYKSTLSEQFAPKLTFSLKALSLLTAALSFGPSVQPSKDYFGGLFSLYMQIALSSAIVLLVSNALWDITDQIVEGYVARRGSDEAKQIMKLNDKMKRFRRVLKESPLLEYARFLKALPEELFKELVEDTEVTLDKLGDYIFEHLEEENEVEAPLLLNDVLDTV